MREEQAALEDHAAVALVGRQAGDVRPSDPDRARRRLQARDAAQEAGLPGAGCAHECDDAALVEREAGGVDGDESVRVGHAQVLDVKQGHGSSLSCVRSGS